MTTMTIKEAIEQAIFEEMRRDPRVVYFGEGVATQQTRLVKEFGIERVRNTPLAEGIIAGTAAGAAATGLRPIIDLLFVPFICYSMDQIVNSAGKLRYMSGGQFSFPLVTLAMTGAGWTVGAHHNHNLEAWFAHAPGLKVVMPSNPRDAKGLMKAAIRDDNPVMFFIDMSTMFNPGDVGGDDEVLPIGKATVCRDGTDVTVVTYSKMVHTAMEAAEKLHEAGVSTEVIDLRTVSPIDEDAVLQSVTRTGRLVVLHEANRTCGVGAEIAATVAEKAFAALKAPIARVTGPDVPPPSSYMLEQAYLPSADAVVAAARGLMA